MFKLDKYEKSFVNEVTSHQEVKKNNFPKEFIEKELSVGKMVNEKNYIKSKKMILKDSQCTLFQTS
jgi:hypothetical protein